VRYVRKGEVIPEIELKFARDDLDDYQIRTRKKLPLSGMDLWFSSIEVNVAFKEELLKSPKDMEDAKHLRIIYSGRINENEIDKVKGMIRKLRLSRIR
jgi:predicted nucleic acid-binding protein